MSTQLPKKGAHEYPCMLLESLQPHWFRISLPPVELPSADVLFHSVGWTVNDNRSGHREGRGDQDLTRTGDLVS